ncbi:hypothetical protein D3C84_849420 [compost metagenome]
MIVGDDAQVDIFVRLLEGGHPGQQPQGRHRRAGGHGHLLRAAPMADFPRRMCQPEQGILHDLVVLAACGSQVHGPGGALEQALAEKVFQQAYLAADCPLSDVEFLGGKGEAQMPRSGFERHETVERGHWLNLHGGTQLGCRFNYRPGYSKPASFRLA